MMKRLAALLGSLCCVAFLLVLGSLPLAAQTSKRNARPAATPSPTPTPLPEAEVRPEPGKKNGRPSSTNTTANDGSARAAASAVKSTTSYLYEFTRPEFLISHVLISHDDAGRGTITFKRKGSDEEQTDPISLSAATLGKINGELAALNFLDSTESYQYEKDYSHLGNIAFTYRRGGRERTARYNWTPNLHARAIADEYRKITNQYIWQFDMTIALENQPLDAPQLMDTLDGYLRRGEISDPKQMVTMLSKLSNDERIPLIARNHATRLIAQIEKDKK